MDNSPSGVIGYFALPLAPEGWTLMEDIDFGLPEGIIACRKNEELFDAGGGYNFKNAFNCKKCPQRNGPEGCPAWLEIIETEIGTGAVRVNKACFFIHQPNIAVELIKAANRPAKAIESLRNEYLARMDAILVELPSLARLITPEAMNKYLAERGRPPLLLESKDVIEIGEGKENDEGNA